VLLTRRQIVFLACLGLALLACSCSSGPARKRCYPVTGSVQVKGQPAQGVLVVFYPANKPDPSAPSASATTDSEGKFKLSTYEADDGAPPGDYDVALTWRADGFQRAKGGFKKSEDQDRFKGKYRDPKNSGLSAHVGEQPTELQPFTLP
jgi:hypothetical protein